MSKRRCINTYKFTADWLDEYLEVEYAISDKFESIGRELWSESEKSLVSDYIQKFRWNLDDLNYLLQHFEYTKQNIIYLIVLVDWLNEASRFLCNKYKKHGLSVEMSTVGQYQIERFKALRSIVVAHPLNTTDHKKFQLDGSFIAKDLSFVVSPFDRAFDISDAYDADFYIHGLYRKKGNVLTKGEPTIRGFYVRHLMAAVYISLKRFHVLANQMKANLL